MRECEFIVVFVGVGINTESNEWETFTILLRHDDESELFKRIGEVIGGSGQVAHDGFVTLLAKTDELVILSNNLRRTLGEVESERGLIGAKIIDVEDKLLGKVLWCSPDDPTNTRVDESISIILLIIV
jgi:hypothetical protein